MYYRSLDLYGLKGKRDEGGPSKCGITWRIVVNELEQERTDDQCSENTETFSN